MHRHVKGIFYQARIISLGVITRSRQQKECGISFSGITYGRIGHYREGKSPPGVISIEDSNSDYWLISDVTWVSLSERKYGLLPVEKVQLLWPDKGSTFSKKCWTPSTSQVLLQDVEGGSIAGQLGSDNAITCVVSGRGRWADGNQNVWSYLIKFKCCSWRPWRPCPSNKLKTMGPLHFSRLGGQGKLQVSLREGLKTFY